MAPYAGNTPPAAAVAASDGIVGLPQRPRGPAARRARPRTWSVTVARAANEGTITRKELLSSLFQLIVAGHHTTDEPHRQRWSRPCSRTRPSVTRSRPTRPGAAGRSRSSCGTTRRSRTRRSATPRATVDDRRDDDPRRCPGHRQHGRRRPRPGPARRPGRTRRRPHVGPTTSPSATGSTTASAHALARLEATDRVHRLLARFPHDPAGRRRRRAALEPRRRAGAARAIRPRRSVSHEPDADPDVLETPEPRRPALVSSTTARCPSVIDPQRDLAGSSRCSSTARRTPGDPHPQRLRHGRVRARPPHRRRVRRQRGRRRRVRPAAAPWGGSSCTPGDLEITVVATLATPRPTELRRARRRDRHRRRSSAVARALGRAARGGRHDERDIEQARRQLTRIGMDEVAGGVGHTAGGRSRRAPGSYRRATFDELAAEAGRRTSSWMCDAPRSTTPITSAGPGTCRSTRSSNGIPSSPPGVRVWVYCAGGFRAGTATSLLHRAGVDVVHVDDAFTAENAVTVCWN